MHTINGADGAARLDERFGIVERPQNDIARHRRRRVDEMSASLEPLGHLLEGCS